ncbi:MAG: GNAT family N-acetyltransferase [Paracoccaceae bacterium]
MTWTPGDLVALDTQRFSLRSITREDVDETFLSWLADPEVMVGLNLPSRKLSRVQAVHYALSYDNLKSIMLLVRARDSGDMVGFFTITFEYAHGTAETAVVIGNKSYWGQNVVVETRGAILEFLFLTLGVHKVIGRPHGRNMSSIFNYKAMGFQCEAILREQMRALKGGGRLDQMIFGLLKSEWEGLRAQKEDTA